MLEGGAGWAVLEAVAAHSVQYELTCRQQPSGLERGDAKRLKVCVVSFCELSCMRGGLSAGRRGTRCVAAPVVRPRKCQQARRARRAQLCSDARLRARPAKRLRGCTHLPVPPPESVPEGVIGYSAVLLRWAPTKLGASLVACRALLRLPDEPARLSNAELTGKALRERNELCAKSAIGCRSKPDEPHAVELLRAQQARLRTRPHFECCEYPKYVRSLSTLSTHSP